MGRFFLILIPVLLVSVPLYFLVLKSPPPMPDFDLDEWWGPQSLKSKQDTSVKPFKITFSNDMVKDLKNRLKSLRRPLTPPLEGIGFEYGFNSNQMEAWTKYWAEEYPFAEREKFLNKYPHFKTNIQGLNIHFMRIKPEVPAGVETVPLLLLHGWPGSVREFYEAIPILTAVSKDRNFALELIVPSLPGYGFSDAAVRPGLGAAQMAVIFRNLMQRLGFKRFYIQGGDWGGIICNYMSTIFPQEILGYHVNGGFTFSPAATFLDLIGSLYPPLVVESKYADRMYPLGARYSSMIEEAGYLHIQATKPDTVGVGLTDSPAGLLAYILEKFSTWTNKQFRFKEDGNLGFRWTKDQLLDNLMFYWTTNSITTSMRLYSETFNSKLFAMNLDQIPTSVPTWIIQPKNELVYIPASMLRFKFTNLVRERAWDDGGHFLAFELPRLFAEDVLAAIQEFRKLNNVNTEL